MRGVQNVDRVIFSTLSFLSQSVLRERKRERERDKEKKRERERKRQRKRTRNGKGKGNRKGRQGKMNSGSGVEKFAAAVNLENKPIN